MNQLKPVTKDFFQPFRADQCETCGECLTHCPVIHYTPDQAKSEMQNLVNGRPTKKLLAQCQSCFTCNFYCKNNANPASLILQRWHEQYERDGLRVRGRYYMTLYPNYPNFRTYGIDRMTNREKSLLEKWRRTDPLEGDTLTFPGCNVLLTPTLTQASFLQDMDIRGRLEYCCGETLFRTGYTEALHQVSARLDKWFYKLKPRHLVVLCTAGANVLKNILPNYGLTYAFESITPYLELLWERLENNDIKVTQPLNMTVTIQDSCYAKMFGDAYMDLPRKILKKIGCDVIEMACHREDMRCCGIAAGFSVDSAYHIFNIRSAACKSLDMAGKTRADALCVYCSGCHQTLYSAKKLYFKPFRQTIYHIIELIQLAIGETPERLIKRTSNNIYWGVVRNQLPRQYARKTFKLPPIPEDPADTGY